jgi:hypothetical protein
MRTEEEIREKIKRLLRKPTRPEDKGFSEAMRKTEADVLKWVPYSKKPKKKTKTHPKIPPFSVFKQNRLAFFWWLFYGNSFRRFCR